MVYRVIHVWITMLPFWRKGCVASQPGNFEAANLQPLITSVASSSKYNDWFLLAIPHFSLVKHSAINNLHHEVFHGILIHNVWNECKPVGLKSTADSCIAEIPVFRVPAGNFPVYDCNFEIWTSTLVRFNFLDHNVLRLQISMGKNSPVAV